ncbi:hypothetical protein [Marinomonas pollencensis]|uniref:Uncharacterized protein n=1 Tax=Marinomonas pollencensis TaxID=491954 RepID=A0A3E0DKT9_9GAMM|nr:hypothetical protein [Marinomonas pollencensis]REG82682.1 hypothetical protein DFP81_108116 [Marinomonas pollencensis]
MNTVRLKQIGFWSALALIIIVALTWGVDKIIPQQRLSDIGQCDKTEHECVVSLPGEEMPATLSFDEGVHVNTPIPVSLSLPQDLADKTNTIRLTLSCKEVYMGVSSIRLTQKPEPNVWQGTIRLPESETEDVTWQVKATLIENNGDEKNIWFEFDVSSTKALRTAANN